MLKALVKRLQSFRLVKTVSWRDLQAAKVSGWWGIAYTHETRATCVMAIIPLSWILGAARRLFRWGYWQVYKGCDWKTTLNTLAANDKTYYLGWQSGKRSGFGQGYSRGKEAAVQELARLAKESPGEPVALFRALSVPLPPDAPT